MNKDKIKDLLPIGFGVLGSVLNVASVITASLYSSKIKEKIRAYKENNPNHKSKDIIKLVWKDCLPIAMLTTASIGLTTSGMILSKKKEMSLVATAAAISQGYLEYQEKVKQRYGLEANQEIIKEVAMNKLKNNPEYLKNLKPDTILYYEKHVGFFIANPENMLAAYARMNERLVGANTYEAISYMVYNLSDLLDDAGAVLLNKDMPKEYLQYGWGFGYLNETYGNLWVHMSFSKEKDDNQNDIVVVTFEEEPVWYPEAWYEWNAKMISDEEYYHGMPQIEGD